MLRTILAVLGLCLSMSCATANGGKMKFDDLPGQKRHCGSPLKVDGGEICLQDITVKFERPLRKVVLTIPTDEAEIEKNGWKQRGHFEDWDSALVTHSYSSKYASYATLICPFRVGCNSHFPSIKEKGWSDESCVDYTKCRICPLDLHQPLPREDQKEIDWVKACLKEGTTSLPVVIDLPQDSLQPELQ